MRRIIVAAAFVVALVSVGVGSAAASWYWSKRTALYSCQGTTTGVKCRNENYTPAYSVWIVKNAAAPEGTVIVAYQGSAIFSCDVSITPAGNCDYFGP